MGDKIRFFEFRTKEGQVIFNFILVEKVSGQEVNSRNPEGGQFKGGNSQEGNSAGNNDSPMTDAQKRFLFRILADQGLQGELAHQELINAFRVNRLTEVGKFEASKMIERLLAEGKGGLKNGSPIQ
jgi:hypothetical protein